MAMPVASCDISLPLVVVVLIITKLKTILSPEHLIGAVGSAATKKKKTAFSNVTMSTAVPGVGTT